MDPLAKRLRETLMLRTFAWLNIPLLWWAKPSIIENTAEKMEIKIPLNRRTKNHLGSMYFGALVMGGEGAVGIKAAFLIHQSKKKINFVFKDFHADFLKRADGDVHFICDQIPAVQALIDKAAVSEERHTAVFQTYAVVPKNNPTEKVATFSVTLSVKRKT
jgi:hypothetical protein